MAGGKKLPSADALTMAFKAMDQGAAGVDMGRNIFQRHNPVAMIQAVRGIVHDGLDAAQAHQLYVDLSDGADD